MPQPPIIDLKCPCRCLTSGPDHYFYGYYDNPAWSADQQYHLCHRVKFWDRIPTPQDSAVLGLIRLENQHFLPIAETTAWNFQQGSMLQWHPQAPNDLIIFNRFVDGRLVAAIRNVKTGDERHLPRPLANVDPTGRFGLSVNFSRLFAFRPGYGYPHLPDPNAHIDHPADDGIWRVDLQTGKSDLILSLRDIAAVDPQATSGRKILINHINFNTDGTRFVFLSRTFATPANPHWTTAIYTADLDGNCFPLRPYAYASHYHWRDPQHVLFHSGTHETTGELRLLSDLSPEEQLIDPAFFKADGHCSYSPDRRWLLYDSYPIAGYRYLYLYDLVRQQGLTLGAFRSGIHDRTDYRTDLHPRWNRTGTAVSFDSTHEDCRRIYTMDLTELLNRPTL